VVAWGHWISPSPQHLRGVSQAANHIRSWLPADPNCPTPLEEPAFQDWILHTTQIQATVDQIEAWRLKEEPTQRLNRDRQCPSEEQLTVSKQRLFFSSIMQRRIPPEPHSHSSLLCSITHQTIPYLYPHTTSFSQFNQLFTFPIFMLTVNKTIMLTINMKYYSF
jgi:hypothetical protein